MKPNPQNKKSGFSRRDCLKLSGLSLGGLALGGALSGPGAAKARAECIEPHQVCYPTDPTLMQQYSYPSGLTKFYPNDPSDPNLPLAPDEMRISFLGSMIPAPRRAAAEMSIFVEVGPWIPDPRNPTDPRYGRATDSFVFDCGSGVCANYGAMNISYGRMNKIFLTHLHADHMSDLTHIYSFGAGAGRYSPLYVWGPGPSGVRSPGPMRRVYDDGTNAMCRNLREALRWCTESFSFQNTAYASYHRPTRQEWGLPCDPLPVGGDDPDDGYAMVPIQLDWRKNGKDPQGRPNGDNVAYHNKATGVKITHFPVIHCRKGSIGFKLEWTNPNLPGARPLTMMYTGDTKPETNSIDQANNGGQGVDVFVHEMNLPPEIWAMQNLHLTEPASGPQWDAYVQDMTMVENSSHTPQGAFGYLLSQINPRPRLAVATHFQTADDTVACAWESITKHFPPDAGYPIWGKDFIVSFDLTVLRVTQSAITQMQAVVPNFGSSPLFPTPSDLKTPKYWTWALNDDGSYALDENGHRIPIGDPYAQIDVTTQIDPGADTYCKDGY